MHFPTQLNCEGEHVECTYSTNVRDLHFFPPVDQVECCLRGSRGRGGGGDGDSNSDADDNDANDADDDDADDDDNNNDDDDDDDDDDDNNDGAIAVEDQDEENCKSLNGTCVALLSRRRCESELCGERRQGPACPRLFQRCCVPVTGQQGGQIFSP